LEINSEKVDKLTFDKRKVGLENNTIDLSITIDSSNFRLENDGTSEKVETNRYSIKEK